MSLKGIDVSPVADADFQRHSQEVLALPQRKQAKRRSRATDSYGVVHRTQYLNGHFVYKHCSTWVTLAPLSFLQKAEENGQLTFDDAKAAEGWGRVTNAINGGDQDAVFHTVCEQLTEESATGNHRSKTRKFKVPTAAGEPVRG
jgi:hypothetical protein